VFSGAQAQIKEKFETLMKEAEKGFRDARYTIGREVRELAWHLHKVSSAVALHHHLSMLQQPSLVPAPGPPLTAPNAWHLMGRGGGPSET
jgi:hypothetical protein